MITEEALPTYMAMLNTLDGARDETGAADTPWGRSALPLFRKRLMCFARGKNLLSKDALDILAPCLTHQCIQVQCGESYRSACTFIFHDQLESGEMHAGGLASGQQRRTGMATS